MHYHMFAKDGVEKKRCNKCLEWQPLGCFNKEKRKRDGLSNTCRCCQNRYRRQLKEKRRKQNSLFLSKTTCLAQCLLFETYYGFAPKEDLSLDSLIKTILDAPPRQL